MSRIWSEEGEYLTHLAEKKSAAKKAPAVKAVLSAAQMRSQQQRMWERNNPIQASYDNDGNPIERDK